MEVRRFYVQNGQTIENSKPEFSEGELSDFDSITDEFCAESKMLYGDYNDHDIKGGLQVNSFKLKSRPYENSLVDLCTSALLKAWPSAFFRVKIGF